MDRSVGRNRSIAGTRTRGGWPLAWWFAVIASALAIGLTACGAPAAPAEEVEGEEVEAPILDRAASETAPTDEAADEGEDAPVEAESAKPEPTVPITQSLRPDLSHGPKTAEFQKYIVLHDTEGGGVPLDVIDGWESSGEFVASHFVIGRDGEIVQAVPLDEIAHHAGYGDAGHNDLYGTQDESRDDFRGTTPIGDWAPDYGMNSHSIGIEMIHEGATGEDYPEEQLEALDALIAYIDAYYGFESQIIDHKAWRSYNSDTSPEFAGYLQSYQTTRTHDGG